MRKRTRSVAVTKGIPVAVVLSCVSGTAAEPTFVPLPVLPGGLAAIPWGVSKDGSAVVGLSYNMMGQARAIRWPLQPPGPMEDLGTLPAFAGAAAQAVSADGSVVVGTSGDGQAGRAVRWTGSGIEDLGLLPGRARSVAQGVSGDGAIVVGYGSTNVDNMLAYRWTPSGGMTALPLAAGHTRSQAVGVSHDGNVIVGAGYTAAAREVAVKWVGNSVEVLPELPGATGCRAWSASADGSVIVGHCRIGGEDFPVRWEGGVAIALEVPAGYALGQARAVSADGSVAAGFLRGGAAGHGAIVWSQNAGTLVLGQIAVASVPPGFELQLAVSVSGDGKAVAVFCDSPLYIGQAGVVLFGDDPCYADCDGNEMLNIDDFLCFIDEFAAARSLPTSQQVTHYANCDGSTSEPVLGINDFLCFIDEFAAGCP